MATFDLKAFNEFHKAFDKAINPVPADNMQLPWRVHRNGEAIFEVHYNNDGLTFRNLDSKATYFIEPIQGAGG